MINSKIIMILFGCIVLLTGCWDTINVEDRGFVIGMALDLDEEADGDNLSYKVTHQLVIPAGMGSPSTQNGESKEAFLNVTTKGKNLYNINENLSTKTSKVPYFEHLKVLILSERLARMENELSNILDTFIRDVDMRRGIKVIIAKDEEAKQILESTTSEEKLPTIHINKLLEQSNKHFGYLEAITVGDIEESHLRETSYILPLLKAEDTLIYKYSAAIHGPKRKMVGVIEPREMLGIEIATKKSIEELIKFEYKDKEMAFEIIRISNIITVDPKDINNIKVNVAVNVVGSLKETYGKLNLKNQKILKDIENAAAKHMEGSIKMAINKGQNELNTDILNVWERLESKHYHTWTKIKDDWEQGENYFSKANFNVHVNAEIYSIGTSNETD